MVVEITEATAIEAATESKVVVDKTMEEIRLVRVIEAPKIVVDGAKAVATRATTELNDMDTKRVEEA